MPRAVCPECRRMALVLDGEFACCGCPYLEQPTGVRRMSEPSGRRKAPIASVKRSILAQQGNACLYCERAFGSLVDIRGELVVLRIEWDHFLPHAYSADNGNANFCAACHVCNRRKSDHMFQDLNEARVFLACIENGGDGPISERANFAIQKNNRKKATE